jgi:tetratricopeptide (TPR) repeat protein
MAPTVKNTAVGLSFVLFLLPSFTLANNYFLSDRSRDFTPFDYGWNLLVSCDKDAVLITSADNDTFPLWCLQEAYGIRKDVDVVNLSLANTKWYIKQLRSALGIKMSWSEEDIDSLRVFRDQHGNVHRLQHQVVTDIIGQNFGRRPIHFSMTAPASSHMFLGRSIDSLLVMQGLVWRLEKTGSARSVDVEASIDLLTNPEKCRYRSIADTTIYMNETTMRLARNYIPSFLLVADSLRKAGDFVRAEFLMEKAVEFIPFSRDGLEYLAAIYGDLGKREELDKMIENNRYADVRWLKTIRARLEKTHGSFEETEMQYLKVLSEYPDYRVALDDLIRFYYAKQRPDKMKAALTTWLRFNPDDLEMKQLLDGLEKELKRTDMSSDSS